MRILASFKAISGYSSLPPRRRAHRGSGCTPQPGFSRASRRTSALMFLRVAGLPVLPRMNLAA